MAKDNRLVKDLNGRIYSLRYTLADVEKIEHSTQMSIFDVLRTTPNISTMRNLIGFALYNDEGNKVSAERGVKLAGEIIQAEGSMLGCFNKAVEALADDCGFLFHEN